MGERKFYLLSHSIVGLMRFLYCGGAKDSSLTVFMIVIGQLFSVAFGNMCLACSENVRIPDMWLTFFFNRKLLGGRDVRISDICYCIASEALA